MTTNIRAVTLEEFRQVPRGRPPWSVEMAAVFALEVGHGLAIPCRWKHYKRNTCGGTQLAYTLGRRKKRKYATRCWDKFLYVWRLA